MKVGLRARSLSSGYTIIEVLIVLAVTSVLLVAAIATISGQQQKTEFSQAIRDVESQIRDIINDVEHGFYPSTNNFSCSSSGGGPILNTIASSQGSNKDCIFIGRAIQFSVSGSNGREFNIYTIVGQRQVNVGAGAEDVKNLNEAHPTAVAPSTSSSSGFPDATDPKTLNYGLNVKSMKYVAGSTSTNIGTVAFINELSNLENNNPPVINLMPVASTTLDEDPLTAVDSINNLNSSSLVNPDGGVEICFDSAGTQQNGVITIGSNGRELSTKLVINKGVCA